VKPDGVWFGQYFNNNNSVVAQFQENFLNVTRMPGSFSFKDVIRDGGDRDEVGNLIQTQEHKGDFKE
jgi:hypothetical protein